jgi:hypothetical protein
MTDIKPSSHGIVVEHKETGTHYAVSDKNYNPKVHRKVRDLKVGESVLGYKPKRRESVSGAAEDQVAPSTPGAAAKSESDGSEALSESAGSAPSKGSAPKTEGSASAGTQG